MRISDFIQSMLFTAKDTKGIKVFNLPLVSFESFVFKFFEIKTRRIAVHVCRSHCGVRQEGIGLRSSQFPPQQAHVRSEACRGSGTRKGTRIRLSRGSDPVDLDISSDLL